MKYNSTRNKDIAVTSAQAIVQGLSSEGGLFVPNAIPRISEEDIINMADMSYQKKADKILSLFLSDFTSDEVHNCVVNAYSKEKFETDAIAPLYKLNDMQYILELWHGPTCAFKDMALQILPHLLTTSVKKIGLENEVVILVATSGDTGKAALEGFKNVNGTKIVVFFPAHGVSDIQKLQMCTQEGNNVFVSAVNGNFDDAQNGVKAIFTNDKYKEELDGRKISLSSANSINWGRLVPQIVYYFSAYCDMVKSKEIKVGDKVNICVPTGNFGNILAGYYAYLMGLPVNKFICASNSNNVLTDFIRTGVYDKNREFLTTISPSMDILISSNLERLLYILSGEDSEKVSSYMKELKESGRYEVSDDIKEAVSKMFYGGYCDDNESKITINSTEKNYGYVIDTHTSVAVKVHQQYVNETKDTTKTIIASTASPFKFNGDVLSALLGDLAVVDKDEFELLDMMSDKFALTIPKSLGELRNKEIRFETVCDKENMLSIVNEFLNK